MNKYLAADIQLIQNCGCQTLHSTYFTPCTYNTFSDRSFSVSVPRVCNSLLADLRPGIQLRSFKGNSLLETAAHGDCLFCVPYKYSYLLVYFGSNWLCSRKFDNCGNFHHMFEFYDQHTRFQFWLTKNRY